MKIVKISSILMVFSFLIYSCYQDPVGYIGLKDVDGPIVRIEYPPNETEISDTLQSVFIDVAAFDLFGLNEVTLFINSHSLKLYGNGPFFKFEIPHEFFKDDSNIVYAKAQDNAKNISISDKNIYSFKRSIVITNPVNDLELLDISEGNSIDLNQIFKDTYGNQNELNFELITNSNPKVIVAEVSNNKLLINPKRYFSGNSAIIVKAYSGKRSCLYQLNVKINLSKPLIKIKIKDNFFKEALIKKHSFTDFEDDSVALDDAQELLYLNLEGYYNITDIDEIQYFIALENLHLIDNHITSLNLSNNINLKNLELRNTGLKNLNLENLINLEVLFINAGIIGPDLDLDLSHNPNLKELSLGMLSYITDININLSNNKKIDKIIFYEVNIKELDLSEKQYLSYLTIRYSKLSILDLGNNSALEYINLLNNADLTKTFVWQLPLPSGVELHKDNHNNLIVH